jgi:hypothetical protein
MTCECELDTRADGMHDLLRVVVVHVDWQGQLEADIMVETTIAAEILPVHGKRRVGCEQGVGVVVEEVADESSHGCYVITSSLSRAFFELNACARERVERSTQLDSHLSVIVLLCGWR